MAEECEKKLADAIDNQSAARSKEELLRFQVQELEALSLEQDEYAALEQQQQQMANRETLLRLAASIYQQLDEENGSESLLNRLNRSLSQLAPYIEKDPTLKELYELIDQAQISLSEAAQGFRDYAEKDIFDPAALKTVEGRLSSIHTIARKYGVSGSELHLKLETLTAELADISNETAAVEQLQAEAEAYYEALIEACGRLSERRHRQVAELSKRVTQQIKQLGLPKAQFRIHLYQPEDLISSWGRDKVEFMISTNPGQPEGAIKLVASGGELSRISLAIQVICSTKALLPPTMIFDEVDVGVGGAVAESVGKLLRTLGQQGQVICITHLPQVAAQGNHHIHVDKIQKKQSTLTKVSKLTQDQKVLEIARMLGGAEIGEQTVAHAKEMLASAG